MSIPIQDDPFYTTLLERYYNGGPYTKTDAQAYQDAINARFTAITGIRMTDASTPQTQKLYQTIVQQYHAWSFQLPVLQSTNALTDTFIYYKAYISSNYEITDQQEQNDLWNAFLYEQGYCDPSTGVISNPPGDTQDLRTAFASFIKILQTRDSYYIGVFHTYFAGGTTLNDLSVFESKLWDRYCFATNNAFADPSDPAVLSQFKAFISLYSSWGTTTAVLESTNTLPDASDPLYSFFTNYLSAFYGNLSEIQRTDLWNSFLANQGFVDNTGQIYTPTNPQTVQKLYEKFAQYIKGILSNDYYSSQMTGLAPSEHASRVILSNTVATLGSMLKATEDIVKTQASSLIIYGQLQQEYTKMMANVPTITGIDNPKVNQATTVQIPMGSDPTQWDLTQFTFGFNKISLADFIQYAVQTTTGNSPQSNATLNIHTKVTSEDASVTGDLYTDSGTFAISRDPTDQSLTCTYKDPVTGATFTSGKIPTVDVNGNPLLIQDVPNGPFRYQQPSDWVAQALTAFKTLLKNATTTNSGLLLYYRGGQPGYRYPPQGFIGQYTSNSVDLSNPTSQDLTLRGQQNALLEQYAQNVQAKRNLITSAISKLQNSLSGTQQSINQICNTWLSTLDAMSKVLKAIFRMKK